MPKKVKNDMDDNFDFDTGGMSEFFPLEKPSTKKGTPPKGTKGYLKNVAKSVFNLGVKVNKHLYPEAFELGESIGIGSNNENRINVKGILNDANREIKKWSGIGKDTVKEVVKDSKEAIRTGYFVKTEEEAMNMDAMFSEIMGDDFGFDDGDVTFDGQDEFALDDGGFDTDDGTESTTGASIDFGEAIVKSEYASTKALVNSNVNMINSSLSAAQAHIKNEKLIFAQQLSVLQEHHVEKMGILRNIATNIGKNIEQGNISLRAQMEFSAKSLAFAQDTAAMIKEVRDSMWKMTKPEEKEEVDRSTMFGKVFGNGTGLNLKEWLGYYKSNAKMNAAGGIFDSLSMIPESIETMASMGLTPAQAIKSMAGGMIGDALTDAFISSDTRQKINAFNTGLRSLPGAINAKLGELASNSGIIEDKINRIPIIGKILDKHNISGKVAELISNQAGYAHMFDNTTVLSEKYMMGKPNEVHPFDNKAHKVLTEVIPYQLSEINAGVNHKEAEYFDFKLNKFMPKSYMKSKTEEKVRNVIKGTMGYSDIENEFNSNLALSTNDEVNTNIPESDKPFYDDNGKLITEMISSEFDRLLANLHRNQLPWTKETAKKIKENENYKKIIFNGTTLELTSDELKDKVADLFSKTLTDQMTINGDAEKAERNRYLRAGGLSYAGDLSDMYAENEDEFAGMGNSIDYYSMMKDEDNKQELRKAEFELDKVRKLYNENHLPMYLTKLHEAKQRVTELRQLAATTEYAGGVNTNINTGFDINKESDFDFNNFAIKTLDDSSEYGLVQNIYNLLLSGIDVYNKNEPSTEHEELVGKAKYKLGQNKKRDITTINTFQKSTEYEEAGTGATINEKLKEDGRNENGKVENWRMSDEYRFTKLHPFHFYEYDDKTGKYSVASGELDPNKTYYRRVADINADYKMTVKEQRMERSDYISNSFLQKIPGVKKIYNGINKLYGSATDVANKFIGKTFYGEDYEEEDENETLKPTTKEEKENIASVPKHVKERITKIRKSDETLYSNIKKEFTDNKKIYNIIDKLSKEEKESWNKLDEDIKSLGNKANVTERIDQIIKRKKETLNKVQNLKTYEKLPDNKKEVFDNLKKKDEYGTSKARQIIGYTQDLKKEAKETYEKNESGIDTAIHMGKRLIKDIDDKTHISKLAEIPKNIKDKVNNIRKSDESLYDAIKKEFRDEKEIVKTIDDLSKEEKGLWDILKEDMEDIRKDPNVSERIDQIIKRKNEVMDHIQNTKAYKALPKNKKEVFEKLKVEDKKAEAKEWTQKIKTNITKTVDKVRANKKLNEMIDKGEDLKDSIINSDKAKKTKEKANNVKDKITETTDKGRNFIKKTAKAIKDETVKETFGDDFKKIKDSITKKKEKGLSEFNKLKIKILNEKMSPLVKKELNNELINLKSKDNTKLGTVIDNIHNPYFIKDLQATTDPVEKAKFILSKSTMYSELEPFKEPVTTFIEKRKGTGDSIQRAASLIIQKKINKVKDKVDSRLKKHMDKTVSKELLQLKVDDKTLYEVLAPILETNKELNEKLSNASTAADKANILLRNDDPDIQKFKPKIREFAEKYANDESAVMHGANLLLDKGSRIAKSAFEWFKHKLFDKADLNKRYKKYFDKELIEVFGGEANYIKNIENGGITIEDIEALKTDKKSIIAEYLLKNGRYDRNIKRQLRVYMSIAESDDKDLKQSFINKVINKDNKFFKAANKAIDKNEAGIDEVNKELVKDIPDTFKKRLRLCSNDYEEAIKTTVEFYKNIEKFNKSTVDVEDWIRKNINTDSTMKSNWKKTHKGKVESVSSKPKTGIFKGIANKDDGDGIINSSSEMKKDREDKKREHFLETMASNLAAMGAFFKKADKDGLNLSDKTLDEIDESNKEAAESMSNSIGGGNGLISKLLNKVTGGKFGDLVNKAGNAGGMLTKAGGALSSIGGMGAIGGTVAKIGTRISGAAASAGNIGLKSVATAAKTAGGGLKGLIGRVGEFITKIIKTITSKAGSTVSKAGTKIGEVLKKNITKFAPKLGGKLAALSAAQATILLEAAAFVAGFTKGMYKAKEYFNVGKGMRISFGMKMAAGFGDALNAALMGIPSLIAGFLGFPSVPLMFYNWCGADAEKDALVRYQKFNRLRARILGVADPDTLVAWENRSQNTGSIGGAIKNGLNKGFRAIGSFLTGGMMMSNSEKDATILGFHTTKIYDEWKAKKYDPIDQMRTTIAEEFGGLKNVEDVTAGFIDDENDDGVVDENDEAAQKYFNALKNQASYQVKFLTAARDYVQKEGLEWLSTSCTPEEFEKHTNKSAGDKIVTSRGERVKQGVKNIFKRSFNLSPIGILHNSIKAIKTNGGFVATTKKIKDKIANLYKQYKFDRKQEDMMNSAMAAIQNVFKSRDPGWGNDAINGDNPEGTVGTTGAENASDIVNVGQNGGPGFAAGEGYFVRTNVPKNPFNSRLQSSSPVKKTVEAVKKHLPPLTNEYDLSGRTPKAMVMNSIADDFAKNFGNELNKKLEILKEIQAENVRHHDVAENFFAVTLQLLSQMAKNSGKQNISSRLDSMVREVTSM